MKEFWRRGIVTAGYVGYLPFIKGTLGSLVGLCLYLGLYTLISVYVPALAGAKTYLISGLGAVIGTALCVVLGQWAENYYRQKDPPNFVLDEVAGLFIAFFMIDISPAHSTDTMRVIIVLFVFVVFRFMDGLKPFPIRRLEKLPAGWGIVLDDLLAGVYTNILAQIFIRLVVGKTNLIT